MTLAKPLGAGSSGLLFAAVFVGPLAALGCIRGTKPSPPPEVWVIVSPPSKGTVDVWVAHEGTRRVAVGRSGDAPGCWEVAAVSCGWGVLFPGVPAGTVPAPCASSGPTTCGEAQRQGIAAGEPSMDGPGSMALRGNVVSSERGRVVTATIARSGRAVVSGQVTWLPSGPEGSEDGAAAAIALGCAAVGNDAEIGSTLVSWLVDGANAAGVSLLVRRSGRVSLPAGLPAAQFERLIHELASIDWEACSRP